MEIAYIGLGSNLADPAAQVTRALTALGDLPQTRRLRASRLYRSAPWGLREQPAFVNAVAALETALAPRALLDAVLEIERRAGRERGAERWGPRVLDLDVLLYGAQQVSEPGLSVPHPHLAERAFVLVPLAEIAPGLQVPGAGPIERLLARVDTAACLPLEPDRTLAE